MRAKIESEDLKELILIKYGSLDNFAKNANDEGKKNASNEDIKNQLKNTQDRLASLETILKDKEQIIEHQNNMLKMMSQFIEEVKKKNK